MSIKVTYPAIDDLDANVLGQQKVSIEKALKDKGELKPKGSAVVLEDLSEEDLYSEVLAKVLDNSNPGAVLMAEFDSPEEAEALGLRIDARGKGLIGVGIKKRKVSFWKRNA